MMLQKQQLLLPTAHTVPTTYNTHTHTHFFLPQPPPKSSNPQVKTKGEARMSTAALAYTYNNNTGGGGGAKEAAAAAFTNAQWKELERQAMIYKYMVASVPVPPHLLSSDLSASIPLHNHGYSSIFNLKFGNKKDAEPGRCNRTDGKKWRCSRDVAPHQKYCERHMHRGRPRSRKPVEPLQLSAAATTKKTRLHLPSNGSASTTAPPPPPMAHELDDNPSAFLLKNVGKAEDISLSLSTQHSNRDMNYMMESKMVTMDTSEQQWHQLMSQSSIYSATNTSNFQHNNYGEAEQLNLLSIPEIGNSEADKYESYLNPYYTSKDFIDAWSNDNNLNKNDSSGAVVNENDSPSSLNLSMAMAVSDSYDSEMCQIQMGECQDANQRCQGLSWLSPVSWMGSAPGGPLAEVLRPLSVDVNSIPGCHYAGNSGDAIGPLATSVSSPTDVLQRTMLSLSDSSVCNSPTVAAISTAAPGIVGFQWLN